MNEKNNVLVKKVSIPLGIGIALIPLIFSWFTLRRGYSSTARFISFGWLLLTIVMVMAPDKNSTAVDQARDSAPINQPFSETIEAMADFSSENGSFDLISEQPLNFKLVSKPEIYRDRQKREEDVNRAFLYGVYRAFLHTDVDEVTVTAISSDLISVNPFTKKDSEEYKVSATVKRETALQAIQIVLPKIKSLNEIISRQEIAGAYVDGLWTDEFESIYYKHDKQNQIIQFFLKNQGENRSNTAQSQPASNAVIAQKKPKNRRAPEYIALVVDSLRMNYDIEAVPSINESYCSSENFCQVEVDEIQIQSMGIIVQAYSSLQASPRRYQTVCSAILMGLGGLNKELSEQIIVQGFNTAGQEGEAKLSIGGIEMEISPRSDRLLECRFIKIK